MDRYDFSVTDPTFIGDGGLVRTRCNHGDFVYYDDAQAEIASLSAELLGLALAQAAAAAMKMREQAAVRCFEDQGRFDTPDRIRSLPIDPDAQKALDQMLTEAEQRGYANAMEAERKDVEDLLAKAREDAIREAAAACYWAGIYGYDAVQYILALLNNDLQNLVTNIHLTEIEKPVKHKT